MVWSLGLMYGKLFAFWADFYVHNVGHLAGRPSASEAEGLVVVLPAQLPNLDGVFEAPQFGLTHVRDNGLSETQLPRER